MASQDIVQQLEEQLETINQDADVDLINWEMSTFEAEAGDIRLARSIAADLLSMPLRYLADEVAMGITQLIPDVQEHLRQLYESELEDVPAADRDRIAANLHSAVAGLHNATRHWIPYLKYRRGDFPQSIQELEAAVKNAIAQVNAAESYAEAKRTEVDKIVEAAREASASAGVAIFTSEFDNEAKALARSSKWWLLAVVALAGTTAVWAICSFDWPSTPESANSWITLRHMVAKASVIAVLFAGTVWCGRIYRALRHQRSINRHRALSLKTFQAFVEATDDPVTRDAVLTAATKSIFANVPTGFVEERATGQDTSVNVLEVGKSASKAIPTVVRTGGL